MTNFKSPLALMRQKMPTQYKKLKRLKLTAGGIFTDAWLMDQQIPMQSLNRTLLDYDVTFFGNHQIYAPVLSEDNPCTSFRQLSLHYTPQAIPRPYFFHIENAGVNLPHVVDPAKPNRVIMETLADPTPTVEGKHWRLNPAGRRQALKRARENECDFEEAYIFSMHWWRNHYHFLVDSCATYLQLKNCGAITSGTRILSFGLPTIWQQEYLKILGIDPGTFIDIRDQCVKVQRLLIGSPTRHRFVPSQSAIDCLRNQILDSIVPVRPKPHQKIYVTRRSAGNRRILNDDEVSEFLETRGFKVIEAEKLEVREKIKLFSEAKTIVAPHGAGLANMIFSDRPNIIEFFADDAFDRGYFITLTNTLDGKHTPLVFEPQNALNDYYVDLDLLELHV
ncbi:glycosyltransferase family 61 protein [Ruegeria atlantica]|uniref:glycosyltransferase family 61 protein n=1 Tax=Ruegeria atlantica TaxID=81569 RepID=UPI002494CD37|nr:glycosyltransferase family 61 protein [Ruegeria atlantica]